MDVRFGPGELNKFGRLPFSVSPIGLGTYHLTSDRRVSHEDGVSIIRSAIEHGINVIDTAPLYGVGEAEQIVGEALGGTRSENITVIDKIGRFEKSIVSRLSQEAYTDPELMLSQLNHSLRTLGTDHIPLLLLHETDWDEWGLYPDSSGAPVWEFIEKARKQGKIGGIGLSVRKPDRAEFLCKTGRFDAMLFVHYHNLVWQDVADRLLNLATKLDIGVAVGAPYRQGLLTSTDPGLRNRLLAERRTSVPPGIIERIAAAQDLARKYEMSLMELGLRWLVSDERVHTIIVGPRNPAELRQNVEWAKLGGLPTEILRDIRELGHIEPGEWQ